MNSSKRGAVYGFKLQSLDLVSKLEVTGPVPCGGTGCDAFLVSWQWLLAAWGLSRGCPASKGSLPTTPYEFTWLIIILEAPQEKDTNSQRLCSPQFEKHPVNTYRGICSCPCRVEKHREKANTTSVTLFGVRCTLTQQSFCLFSPALRNKVNRPKANPVALHFECCQGEVPARVPLLQRAPLRGEGCCRYCNHWDHPKNKDRWFNVWVKIGLVVKPV